MLFSSWLRNWKRSAPAARRAARKQHFVPRLEALEDRLVPSGYQPINLASYLPGLGQFTDPNLNGWGMTSLPNGTFCVANPFSTGLATFYDTSGHVLPQTITVPASAAQPFGTAVGQPTGVVYNPTSDFVISEGGRSAPALLIFDTLDGTISGWNPAVDPTHAIPMVDTFAKGSGVLFTGLDMAQNSQGQNILYATEFSQKRVEMFDGSFTDIGSFGDPHATDLDANFGAWSVQAVNDKLYVTYGDPFHVPTGGVVDVFDTDGHLLNRLAANAPGAGPLQNPWGIVQAPANFGAYSGDLLIGNVAGLGNINVYDPATDAYLGQLAHPDGTPIAITGLWDLEFGDGTPQGGNTNQLFFDAGPNAPFVSGYGLFGVIDPIGSQPATLINHTLFLVGGSNTNDQFNITPIGTSQNGSTGINVEGELNNVGIDNQPFTGVTSIHVVGFGGNENFKLADSLTIATSIRAGDGNDKIKAGNGNTTVNLGNGNDHVQLGNGNNIVNLGNGNDHVQLGNGANTVAITGNGNDHVQAGDGLDLVTIAGNGNDQVQIGDGNNDMVSITGNGNDQASLGDGNGDSLSIVGNGNDQVQVGDGNNDMVSILGNGNEDVHTGSGAGTVHVAGTGHKNVHLGSSGWTEI